MKSNKVVLSYSQVKTWKRCRRKWWYGYVKGLRPKGKVRKIELGNYGHHLLEAHYKGEDLQEASQKYWDKVTADMFEEEMDMFTGVRSDAEQLVQRYLDHYGDNRWNVLAIEQDFEVNIRTGRGNSSRSHFKGVLDLVVEEETGGIFLVDHKFTTISFDKFEDSLVLDEQANSYLWALERILGVPVMGIVFNLIRTKLPTVPNLLKNGTLSKAKNMDTDPQTYLAEIHRLGLNPNDYQDILEHLTETVNPFFKQVKTYRTPPEVTQVGHELYRTSLDMRAGEVYRNATKDCGWDCPYYGLCIIDAKQADSDFYIRTNFNIDESRKWEGAVTL